jgi:hypothetical protein
MVLYDSNSGMKCWIDGNSVQYSTVQCSVVCVLTDRELCCWGGGVIHHDVFAVSMTAESRNADTISCTNLIKILTVEDDAARPLIP